MALSPRGDADGGLRFTGQGAPEPGAATVAFETAEGSVSLETDFTYVPPLSPYFERVVAFGASLTMGVMDGTPTYEGVMKGPSLQTARALGAYMPQPLLVPDLFPTVGLDLVGPGPECETANVEEFLTQAIPQILGELAYPDGSGFGYEMGRSDPLLEVRNIGVGGYQLDDVVLGPESDELVQNVLGGFVYAPFADFGVAPDRTMMEVVEDLAPSLLLSFDLLGNDILLGRPATRIAQYLPEVIDRLAATGAEVFIADAPNPDILEGNLGEDIPDEGGEELAEEYNAILGAEAARYDNIHVVPIKEASDGLIADGLVVAGQTYNVQMLGGLLSFDGLHFSDTGYALIAQTFVDAINEALGTEVPPVDIAAVAAEDFHTPEAVLAAGRDPSECWD
jgi:lysophospholipase L1-like esterase